MRKHQAEQEFKAESKDKVVFVTAEEMNEIKKIIEQMDQMEKHTHNDQEEPQDLLVESFAPNEKVNLVKKSVRVPTRIPEEDFEFFSPDEKSITFTHVECLKQRQTFCSHAECLEQRDQEELQNLDVESDEYESDEFYESGESYETDESDESAVTVVNVGQIADGPNKQNQKDRKKYQNVAVESSSFEKEMVDVGESSEPAKLGRDRDQLSTFFDDSLGSEESGVNVGNMAELEKNEQNDCDQNQLGPIPEDFLPKAWTSFSLDHDEHDGSESVRSEYDESESDESIVTVVNHKQKDCDQYQLDPIPEDFLPKAWTSFTLDHDYLLQLSLYGAVSKRR